MPKRGEVWLIDFGITQKVRPALIISISLRRSRSCTHRGGPHTTATRGSQFEVAVAAPFLAQGAFLVQGIQALPPKYFLRRLGVLSLEQMRRVERALLYWQGVLLEVVGVSALHH